MCVHRYCVSACVVIGSDCICQVSVCVTFNNFSIDHPQCIHYYVYHVICVDTANYLLLCIHALFTNPLRCDNHKTYVHLMVW